MPNKLRYASSVKRLSKINLLCKQKNSRIKIARKLRHVYSPDMPSLQLLEGKLKCLLVRIHGGLYLFDYVLDNLNWLVFVFLSNLIINLMYNIKKLYFNDQRKFIV